MFPSFARPALAAALCGAALSAQDLVRLRFASFDPLVATPAVPEETRAAAQHGLWIVQFRSAPSQVDRDAIAAVGGQVIKYLPDNAYTVRMSPAAVAALGARARVRWVGDYEIAYRLEPELVRRRVWTDPRAQRYHIVVADKHGDKPALLAGIRAVGGRVDDSRAGSILVDATLTGPQLLQVAGLDQVLWIDRWSAPETDMDNARIQGGGNYLENQTGYTGAGVNVHVYEGIEAGHVDFTGGATNVQSSGAAQQHGHATAGIVFGNGTSNPSVRGMAPDCGKFYTEYASAVASRWQVVDELVNVHDVSLTTASWGNAQTTVYTSISAESDDIVFDHDIPWTQSQSNTGNQKSRPQAWAKNVFSVGGVQHFDNSNPADDSWLAGSASRGPAADGRIKPTLCAYFDAIGTSDLSGSAGYSGTNWYASFGGTSGATPIVAGHGVLAIQMFTDETGTPGFGKFGNALRVPGGSAHANRPHFTTFKALMVASAEQYPFSSGSTDNRREHQGWGFPNLRNMWDRRGETFLVDETSVLSQGDADVWQITVAPGEPSLKISLNWSEPAANPAAAATRINDLSLRVLAPDGTLYWGNNGLEDGNWSIAGGNEDTVNTIENVFVQNPLAGDWYVQVIASTVVEDNHVETPEVDVDYALVAIGGAGQPAPPGIFASVKPIGVGCDGTTCVDAIYEYPTFGLSNSSLTFRYVNGDYLLVPGQGTWIPPTGANLNLSDNQEVIRNVGFALPYPGGSTGTLRICANGWIADGQFTGASNIVPTPQDFLQ
ncbi:MAG TPA: hypothetical protein ENI87_05925, partial [bacterium]|nr:hypothetical protein [bacterium]